MDPLPELVSEWTRAGDHLLHARTAAGRERNSPVVLLIHGLGVSSWYMVPLARHLARVTAVAALDLPGFGNSEGPLAALTIPELAEAAARWMDARGIERAVVFANSMGCQVAADLAMRHPERVAALALGSPTIDPSARRWWQQAGRLVATLPREPFRALPFLVSDYLHCGPVRVMRTLAHALEDRIEQKLPHIVCPALVLRGEADPIVPAEWGETASRLLPRGEYAVIPETAHISHYDAPAETARLLLALGARAIDHPR